MNVSILAAFSERRFRAPFVPLILTTLLGVSGCGGGGTATSGNSGTATNALPVATTLPPLSAVPNACSDCWPMFEHDVSRSGLQTATTGITSSTVGNLQLRWSYELGESVVASPVVADGLVFVATGAGSVVAIDERTGTPQWRQSLPGPITMTPLVADGLVFAGTHKANGGVYALDEHSGAIRWNQRIPGYTRSAPIVVNGELIIGQSGGDPPGCIQGGVLAYQEMTGVLLWKWNTDPKPHDGGAVWTPISYGGKDIVFGTGNTCSEGVANANGLIRLTPDGKQEWQLPPQIDPETDNDWGGAELIYNGDIYAINKNGYFYAVDGRSGAIKFKLQVTPLAGGDAFGSPATNGSTFVVPAGFFRVANANVPGANASVVGVSMGGQKVWSVPALDNVPGGAAITGDVAFLSIDYRLAALKVSTGEELWSYSPPEHAYAYASPAVVSSGVYYVNEAGDVLAFGLPSANGAAASRAAASVRQPAPHRALTEPYGPIIRVLPNGTHRAVY